MFRFSLSFDRRPFLLRCEKINKSHLGLKQAPKIEYFAICGRVNPSIIFIRTVIKLLSYDQLNEDSSYWYEVVGNLNIEKRVFQTNHKKKIVVLK